MDDKSKSDPLLFKDPAPEQVAHWLLYALLKHWEKERAKLHRHHSKKRKVTKAKKSTPQRVRP